MPDDFPYSMTGDQYRAIIKRLGFADPAQPGDEGISAAARFLGAKPRTGRAWVVDGPSNSAAVALELMAALGVDKAKAERLLSPRKTEDERSSRKKHR